MSSFNVFLDRIKVFFKTKKTAILSLLILFIFGFLIGLFCAIKKDFSSLNKIHDFALKYFLTNYNTIFYILFKITLISIALALLYFLTFLKIGKILILIICLYFLFCQGFTFGILLKHFSILQGTLLAIIYFVFETIMNFIMFFFLLNYCNFNKSNLYCSNCNTKKEIFKNIIFILLIGSILIILEAILLSIIIKLLFIN